MAEEEDTNLPLQPLAMLVYDDGSVRVTTIEGAIKEMESVGPAVQAYAFMGAEFELNAEGDDDESADAPL